VGWWLTGRDEKSGEGRVMLLVIMWMVSGLASQGQSFHLGTVCFNPAPRALARPVALAPDNVLREIVLREIKDPQTGAHWLIVANAANPAGPGRMVLAPDASRSDGAEPTRQVAPVVAIHRGDRVVVEEHTRVAEAYLEAVAMEPAVAGASFHVRLKIGGKVVGAVATAPGRATLMPSTGMPSPEAQR